MKIRTAMKRHGQANKALRPLIALGLASFAVASAPAAQAASQAPTISGVSAAGVTFSGAVLKGEVNPHGQVTNYYFQYGKTGGYGAQTPLAPAGNGTLQVKLSQQIAGLQSQSTYHYRLVATSPAGTSTSADHTFGTPKIPLSLQIAGVPNPVPFGSPFEVEGALSGTGSANHAIVLQANGFPYGRLQAARQQELTNATGAFSFPVVGLNENAQLRVQTVGGPTVTSPVVLENVAVQVTFHARRTHRHGRWRLYGTVTPAEAGAPVGFQRLTPRRADGKRRRHGGTRRHVDGVELLADGASAPSRPVSRAGKGRRRLARVGIQRTGADPLSRRPPRRERTKRRRGRQEAAVVAAWRVPSLKVPERAVRHYTHTELARRGELACPPHQGGTEEEIGANKQTTRRK